MPAPMITRLRTKVGTVGSPSAVRPAEPALAPLPAMMRLPVSSNARENTCSSLGAES